MERTLFSGIAFASILLFASTILAQPRNTATIDVKDKENSVDVHIERLQEEIPGIQEFKVEVKNKVTKERTLHGVITIQDGSTQKECIVYVGLPPGANAIATVRCEAKARSYWQFKVIKVYDFMLE